MANLPSNIQLPTSIPTQDPGLAGYLAQLSIGLNGWIVQAASAVNGLLAAPALAKGPKGDPGPPGAPGASSSLAGPQGPPGTPGPTYSAGAGLSLSGTVFSLTLPVPNSELQNSSITLNSHAVSLGGSLNLAYSDLATPPAFYSNSLSLAAQTTASTTLVMAGMAAGPITPASTGRVRFTIVGDMANNTATDGAEAQLMAGTGTAPVNGAAVTGTQVTRLVVLNVTPSTTFACPFMLDGVLTGLTVGTAYWIDMAIAALTGGTATFNHLMVTAIEF